MPIYRFFCSGCSEERRFLMPKHRRDDFSAKCECGGVLTLTMGKAEPRSMETGDEYRNKKMVSGVSSMLDERAKDHFKKHDLPRIIADHGIEFAKRQGFVDPEGNVI